MENAKKKYKKEIVLQYKYIDSHEAENSLAEVFDDIFKRLIQRKNTLVNKNSILTIT